MNELLELFKKYEAKKNNDSMELILFTDGSGYINSDGYKYAFEFSNIEELITELKE